MLLGGAGFFEQNPAVTVTWASPRQLSNDGRVKLTRTAAREQLADQPNAIALRSARLWRRLSRTASRRWKCRTGDVDFESWID
jgi:hypothetical protein